MRFLGGRVFPRCRFLAHGAGHGYDSVFPRLCLKRWWVCVGVLVHGGGGSPFVVELFLFVVGGKGGVVLLIVWWRLAWGPS